MHAIRLLSTVCLLMFVSLSGVLQQKTSIIFDTDMGPDYDDVGAMAILHALADSGQATILATIASTKYDRVVPVLDLLNGYFGRPSVPVGVPRGSAVETGDFQHWSDTLVARYAHNLKTNAEAVEAVELYRRILAGQPDQSVVIVSVGFFTNLSNLLKSPPDKYSRLKGAELVLKKVKRLVSMAGIFREGREFNIHKDARAAIDVAASWPTPVIFSGFEIGQKIKSGLPLIQNAAISNSPVKDVFRISIPMAKNDSAGRMSWDQTAVFVAIKGHAPYYSLKHGSIVIAENGANTWKDGDGRHSYLVPAVDPAIVEAYINKLMQHQPMRKAVKAAQPTIF